MSFASDGAEENMLSAMLKIVGKFLFNNIIEKRISFYSNNLNLLPPKPKLSFRHLKQCIQQFHEKFVLAPADKASDNAIVV